MMSAKRVKSNHNALYPLHTIVHHLAGPRGDATLAVLQHILTTPANATLLKGDLVSYTARSRSQSMVM